MRPSMGSVGDAYDNAMAESCFASLECELRDRRTFKTRIEARLAVFIWIEAWYNSRRRHSGLGRVPPAEFERKNTPAPERRRVEHDLPPSASAWHAPRRRGIRLQLRRSTWLENQAPTRPRERGNPNYSGAEVGSSTITRFRVAASDGEHVQPARRLLPAVSAKFLPQVRTRRGLMRSSRECHERSEFGSMDWADDRHPTSHHAFGQAVPGK
jgi:hypothetical protein